MYICNYYPQCINIGATPVILSLRFQTIQDNAVNGKDQAHPPSIGQVMNLFVFEVGIILVWTRFCTCITVTTAPDIV